MNLVKCFTKVWKFVICIFMVFFVLSLFFCGLFGFGFLLVLQYIFITFQNRRLAGEVIIKKSLTLPSFGQSYSRALVVLTGRDKPIWLTRIVLKMDKMWQKIAIKIKMLKKYIKNPTAKSKIAENISKSNNFTSQKTQKGEIDKLKNQNEFEEKTSPRINPNINTKINSNDNYDNLQNVDNIRANKRSNPNFGDTLNDNFDSLNNYKTNPRNISRHSAQNLESQDIRKQEMETVSNFDANFDKSDNLSSSGSTSKPVIKAKKPAKTGGIWDNLEADGESEADNSINATSSNNNSTATIGMVGNSTKNDEEMTLFEKQENKILSKLQDLQEQNMGLNHWDLWLELGDLYGKYAQKQKQKEIYTFILSKADHNDKEKELATFRLIGMN